MDNNLNLWSGIELTWENILARTFYGTDIYSHILQTYYPHDFLMHVKGDDCGWVRNPWDWSRPSLHIEIRKMDPKAKLPPRMSVHHDESRHIPDGNVIDFVKKFFNLNFYEAINKINDDFSLGLPIGKKIDKRTRLEVARKAFEANKEREREKEKRKKAKEAYYKALDDWIRLDKQRQQYKPKNSGEELHPLFVEAIKNIDKAAYELEAAQTELFLDDTRNS